MKQLAWTLGVVLIAVLALGLKFQESDLTLRRLVLEDESGRVIGELGANRSGMPRLRLMDPETDMEVRVSPKEVSFRREGTVLLVLGLEGVVEFSPKLQMFAMEDDSEITLVLPEPSGEITKSAEFRIYDSRGVARLKLDGGYSNHGADSYYLKFLDADGSLIERIPAVR